MEYQFVNNEEFYRELNFLQFLHRYGRHFNLSVLLNREAVKQKLENEVPVSFSEFSYQLLQAVDFLHLFQQRNCVVQIGGSDQWGNIINGVDLIQKELH